MAIDDKGAFIQGRVVDQGWALIRGNIYIYIYIYILLSR